MPESLKKLIQTLSFFPGIWEKSATKLAFFLLNSNKNYLDTLSNMIGNLKGSISNCKKCFSLVDRGEDFCNICKNWERNQNIICVVEEYLDMQMIENAWVFEWVYHILWGAISPINGVFAGDLHFEELFEKVADMESWAELILAMNPNIEWEATLQYILSELEKRWLKKFLKTSRLSRGLSSGYLEYADNITLINSLNERKEILF